MSALDPYASNLTISILLDRTIGHRTAHVRNTAMLKAAIGRWGSFK